MPRQCLIHRQPSAAGVPTRLDSGGLVGRGAQCRQPPPALDPLRSRTDVWPSRINTQLEYKATEYYAKELERGVRWSVPDIGIDWPDIAKS